MGKRAGGNDCASRDTCGFQERATAHQWVFPSSMILLNRGKWVDDRFERMVKAGWQDPGGPRCWRVEPRTCP